MAMTQLGLVILASLGTLALLGVFRSFDDPYTGVVIRFAGALIWAFFAFGSFDVIVRNTSFASASEPILPLAFLGIGMAAIMALLGVHEFLLLLRSEIQSTDAGDVL